ncbi:hypothetical protein [Caulobacter sp. NIBR2454]|uniref:hypothetical protein n=1 Tax=Caulobacter sp. NIBR2454 TaxID=3015996 RepID=UPI0022B72779|nr:hypothetical protein [Caulobacter sp. NIBR2454]
MNNMTAVQIDFPNDLLGWIQGEARSRGLDQAATVLAVLEEARAPRRGIAAGLDLPPSDRPAYGSRLKKR